jgi:hypothetical protein
MHRVAWALGFVGLPLSHYWLVAGAEPFYSLIYLFLWWSYIFVADWAVFRLRGRSMLSERPWEFVVIWFWSIPAWLLFEVVNRRIENWYYVMAPTSFVVGGIYVVFAFGAVFPGVFETVELVVALVERFVPGGKIPGRPFVVTGWHVLIQMLVGVAMLVCLLAFPKSCFAFAWGFVFFFLDPLCYRLWRKEKNHFGRSLLGQLAAGDNTRFVAILVGGLICGGLWEGWNLHARTKWIYSVPFFDELKLGEMPILGFLGFPPFALECYAMVNLLSYFRRGRNWELSGEANAQFKGMPGWGIFAAALTMPMFILISGIMTWYSVGSFAEPLTWRFRNELGPKGIEALRERKAEQGHVFLRLKKRPPEIEPAVWDRMRRVAALAELKGIGLKKALLLEELKVTGVEELARQRPGELATKMRELGAVVREEEVKVWVWAARRAPRGYFDVTM